MNAQLSAKCLYQIGWYGLGKKTMRPGRSRQKWSTVFTRPHAMKGHKSIGPMLRNGELKFWTPINSEVEYFLNEETEGVFD